MRARAVNSVLLCLLTAAGLAIGSSPSRAAVGVTDLATRLEADAASFSGTTAIVVADLATGFFYGHDADRVFPAASLYKLGVMVEAYRAASAGQLSLDTTTVGFRGDGPGEGDGVTVREAIERMITVSDNTAATLLIRLLGPDAIDATVASIGLPDTRLNYYRSDQTTDYNTTTAADMARLFLGLLRGAVVSPDASAEMIGVLDRQRVNDRLSTGFPDGTRFSHKTGDLDGVVHDAGIVWTPGGPRVIVVLTADQPDRDAVIALDGKVGADTFNAQIASFAASISTGSGGVPPIAAHPAQPLSRRLVVTNVSSFTWKGAELGAHWRAKDGQLIRWDGMRTLLPDLAPGQSATVEAREFVWLGAGTYILEWEAVIDGLTWSGDSVAVPVVVDRTVALQGRLAPAATAPAPASVRAGTTFPVDLTVTNTGAQAWSAAMTPPLRLGYHWRDAATGAVVIWDGGRATLPALGAGASGTVSATVLAPLVAGTYILEWDLVVEGVGWLSTTGASTALRSTPIAVR